MMHDLDGASATDPAQNVGVSDQPGNNEGPSGQEDSPLEAFPPDEIPDLEPPMAPNRPTPSTPHVNTEGVKDVLGSAIEDQKVAPATCNAKESQASIMVSLAMDSIFLFHKPDGEAFASIMVNGHSENIRVHTKDFRQRLGRLFYKHTEKPPSAQAVKDAMEILEGEGKFGGPEIPMHLRYAWHEGSIYIDICDRNWNQVQITRYGWRVIGSKDSPVKFFRSPGMKAMPFPLTGGSINLLQQYLNITNMSDWVMIVSWLLGSMRSVGPFAILVFQGEQGTAKSSAAKFLRDLLDPSEVPSQSLPRSERDLVIAASKSWVLNFDNLSYLTPWMSDALCRLSTGGGFRTRALRTDDTERLFNSIRPIILNGIADIATRHDLADRSLIVQLQPIPKDRRIPEKILNYHWERSKGQLFGVLCNALMVALANEDSVKLPYLPRMADFATWATAAESAFGWGFGTFMREYEKNQKALVEIALESDPVAVAVIRLIKHYRKEGWQGTASDLLTITRPFQDLTDLKTWPRKANILSGRLKRAAAFLREIGIEVEWVKSGNRFIHITPTKAFDFKTHLDGYTDFGIDDSHSLLNQGNEDDELR